MKIGIAGAGGIGSNVARHLAQAGTSHLLLVDFDVVAPDNLNRQFYSMDQIGRLKVDCLKQNLQSPPRHVRGHTGSAAGAGHHGPDLFRL